MDIERISHQHYPVSVAIAIILSGMIVTVAALLGRGTLNLKGSLTLPEPTEVTVIAALKTEVPEGVTITSIDFLRKEEVRKGERPFYAYLVKFSDSAHYLVRLGYDKEKARWTLVTLEYLRADPAENRAG